MKLTKLLRASLFMLVIAGYCTPAHAAKKLSVKQMDIFLGRHTMGEICAGQGRPNCVDIPVQTEMDGWCIEREGVPYPVCTTEGATETSMCYTAQYQTCMTWRWYVGEQDCKDVSRGAPTYSSPKSGCYSK